MIDKCLEGKYYKVLKNCETTKCSYVDFPECLRRFTSAKPKISYSVNPRVIPFDSKAKTVRRSSPSTVKKYYQEAREKKKLRKQEQKVKVKIFLEDPDEIEQFETGKEKSSEKIAGMNHRFGTPDRGYTPPLQFKSPFPQLMIPPRAPRYCPPTQLHQQNPMRLRQPSPVQLRQPSPMNHTSPRFRQHFRGVTPPPRRFHPPIQRRFSLHAAPPRHRQPPVPHRFDNRRSPSQKRFISPEHRISSPHPSENRRLQFGHSENFWKPRALPPPHQHFRGSSDRSQNSPPVNHVQQRFSSSMPSHSSSRSSPRAPATSYRSRAPRVNSTRPQTPPRNEKAWETKKNLVEPETSMQEADSTTNEDESGLKPRKVPKLSGDDNVSSSGIPLDSESSSVKDFRNYVLISLSPVKNEANRLKRKAKRDLMRLEKEIRKMKLREELSQFEESEIKAAAAEMKKMAWNVDPLQDLKKVNVFDIGTNNQSTLEKIQQKHKKVRVTHGEKKKQAEEKKLAEKLREKNEAPPPPPSKDPPKNQKRLELKKTPEDLFVMLPDVNFEPILKQKLIHDKFDKNVPT